LIWLTMLWLGARGDAASILPLREAFAGVREQRAAAGDAASRRRAEIYAADVAITLP